MSRLYFLYVVLLLGSATPLAALDDSYGRILHRIQARPSHHVDFNWSYLIYPIGGIAILYAYAHLAEKKRQKKANAKKVPRKSVATTHAAFVQRAGALGFDPRESRLLKNLAEDISPRAAESLLRSKDGRELLIAGLERRCNQRQQEQERMRGAIEKLEIMRDKQPIERQDPRLDTNMPVWIVAIKMDSGETEAEPSAGRLLDLSISGAQIETSLPVEKGAVIQFWSADPEIWLPAIRAGVVERIKDHSLLHLCLLETDGEQIGPLLDELRPRTHQRDGTNTKRTAPTHIRQRGFELSDALRTYIEEKCEYLHRICEQVGMCTVELERQDEVLAIEWTLELPHHPLCVTVHSDAETLAAVDSACEHLEAALRRYVYALNAGKNTKKK